MRWMERGATNLWIAVARLIHCFDFEQDPVNLDLSVVFEACAHSRLRISPLTPCRFRDRNIR